MGWIDYWIHGWMNYGPRRVFLQSNAEYRKILQRGHESYKEKDKCHANLKEHINVEPGGSSYERYGGLLSCWMIPFNEGKIKVISQM